MAERVHNGRGVLSDDGEWLHEGEIELASVWCSTVLRRPEGVHLRDGACQCSLDCCLEGTEMPYTCVCPDCTGLHPDDAPSDVFCDRRRP